MSILQPYQPFIEGAIVVVSIWAVLVWAAHKMFDLATPGPDDGLPNER